MTAPPASSACWVTPLRCGDSYTGESIYVIIPSHRLFTIRFRLVRSIEVERHDGRVLVNSFAPMLAPIEMKPTDQHIHLPTITTRLGPAGMHRYARLFLEAAQASPRPGGQFSPVPYYLYGHALEVALKAFIMARGATLLALQRLSHDLERVLNRALQDGLNSLVQVTDEEKAELAKENAYYSGKGFEYFGIEAAMRGYRGLPDLSALDALTQRLMAGIERECLAQAGL
jgi:hypothetical protein